MCRLRPLTFLPPSWPRVARPTVSAPLTDCASTIAAEAIGSRPSASRSWSRSASCTRSRLPSARHRLKYQNTVCHGGNSRGSNRQAQPVRTTYRIALTISRRGCFSRRPAVAGGGNSGSIRAHCSSVRSESYPRGDEGEDATSRKISAIPRQAGRRADLISNTFLVTNFRVLSANIFGLRDGFILRLLAVPGEPAEPGGFEPGLAGLADGFASPVVFVVGADVADAGMEPDPVVVRPDDLQLGAEGGRVADGEQVRVLGLEVPVEAFHPGLVGRGAGASEVLGDRAHGHELPGRSRRHLGSVVGDGEQDRPGVVGDAEVDGAVGVAGVDQLEQPLPVECVGEPDLDLGGGLLDRDERWPATCGRPGPR